MKATKSNIIGKALLVFTVICSLVGSVGATQQPSLRQGYGGQARQVGLESVWVQTSDGQKIKVPKWQIDQMRVLQVLFVYQRGENSKKRPINASMISYENLVLMQEALNIVGNREEFTLFCEGLMLKQQTNLINAAFALEATGLAALLAEEKFTPEIQEKLGATAPGIVEPVVTYLFSKQDVSKKILEGHNDAVRCLAYSPDGNHIVSGSDGSDTNLILWNGKTGERKNLEGHNKRVARVAYSPDGNHIVSGSDDNNLILWNGKTGEQIKILKGHNDPVNCLAYSPDGNYIVSGSFGSDNNLILWNGKTGEQIKILEGHNKRVNCLAYSPDGNYIVSGSNDNDNNLILWNGKTGEQINIFKGHKGWVNCVAYSSDGNYIVSGSFDRNLILWNGKTGEQIKILKGHIGSVERLAYSPDDNYIVSGAGANLILWNSKTGEKIKNLEGHNGTVNCLAYSPDGNYIVSGSNDNNLILWNGKTGKWIKILKGHNGAVKCLAFSPDGNHIVSGSGDSNLILWKLVDVDAMNFIKKELTLSQARFLYRLYLAMLNKVPVMIDETDQDYATYKTLPDNVQDLINRYLPFQLASKASEQAITDKMNRYRSLLKGTTIAEKIKEVKAVLAKKTDKNLVEYKAFQGLLRELEMEAAFED